MTVQFRRLLSLVLFACLLAGTAPAATESGPSDTPAKEQQLEAAAGYDFDFILRLHPEALSPSLAGRAQGYADLLEAVRFHGSYAWALYEPDFDFRLSVIPVDSRGEPVSLHLHGASDLMFLSSPFFGEKEISLYTYSLLNFCSKMSEHLGIPLQYIALLVPAAWEYNLGLPLQDWEGMIAKMDKNGVIPADAVKYLWDCWWYRYWEDEPFNILVTALSKDSEMEESFRAMVMEIPDYFVKQVAQEQEIRVSRDGDKTVWHAATGDFFTAVRSDLVHAYSLTLPVMQTGYLPVFSLESTEESNRLYGRLRAQILGVGALQEDLVNLQASFLALPTVWPADCQSLVSLSLTGGLLPNIGLSVYLEAEENGHLHLELRKPSSGYEPGPAVITLEGDMNPMTGDVGLPPFDLDELEGSLNLLVANDSTIRAFLPDMVRPMLEGMLRFLVGIPASACQAIMDDLTDLGVLELLLGE